jgi:predicted PP-loop superfamily ATPase
MKAGRVVQASKCDDGMLQSAVYMYIRKIDMQGIIIGRLLGICSDGCML